MSVFKRGMIVSAVASGGMGRKPRPAVVVQSDDYPQTDVIIIVPLTSQTYETLTRPVFLPDQTNGLREASRLMPNRIVSVPLSKVGKALGTMSAEDMDRVDAALRLILALDRD